MHYRLSWDVRCVPRPLSKVVINTCFGGFGLSRAAYEWLIAHGVNVGKYHNEPRNPETGLYDIKPPENEGEVIFDRELTPQGEDRMNDFYYEHPDSRMVVRYWESWIDDKRDWPLLVQCVEELGDKANGGFAALKVVEIPDGVEWEIDEYDGSETVAEAHRTWR